MCRSIRGQSTGRKLPKRSTGVIIRCAYRGYGSAGDLKTDEKWNVNIQGAIDAGIKRIGVYIFSQAVNAAEGKEEAEKVLSLIKPYGDKINYPVYWDTEKTSEYPNGRADCISKANRTAAGKAFCEAIKAAGYVPGVYASLSYFDEGVNKTELSCYTWWVAAYRSTRPTAAVDSWQYSSTGRVNGISGDVDKNYWYKEFTPQEAFTGWKKSGSQWYYYEADKMIKNAWRKITGVNGTFWYYMGPTGAMLTGTQKINGKIYHLNEKAACGLPEGALVVTDEDGVVQFK